MDFRLIKLNVFQSEGKMWVIDLHFNVFKLHYYIIYWSKTARDMPYIYIYIYIPYIPPYSMLIPQH